MARRRLHSIRTTVPVNRQCELLLGSDATAALACVIRGLRFEEQGKGLLRMQKLSREQGIDCQISLTPDQFELIVCFAANPESLP